MLRYLTVLPFVEEDGGVLLFGYRRHLVQSKTAVHRDTFLQVQVETVYLNSANLIQLNAESFA